MPCLSFFEPEFSSASLHLSLARAIFRLWIYNRSFCCSRFNSCLFCCYGCYWMALVRVCESFQFRFEVVKITRKERTLNWFPINSQMAVEFEASLFFFFSFCLNYYYICRVWMSQNENNVKWLLDSSAVDGWEKHSGHTTETRKTTATTKNNRNKCEHFSGIGWLDSIICIRITFFSSSRFIKCMSQFRFLDANIFWVHR